MRPDYKANGDTLIKWNYKKDYEIEIPDNITKIGSKAFRNCKNLKKVIIPKTVTSIGSKAFYGCTNLIDINIPDSVKYIDEYAFANCTALKEFTFPKEVKSIEAGMFYMCSNLTSVSVPDRIFSIGEFAFYNCVKLSNFEFPKYVDSIFESAFEGCESLKTIIIPSSTTFMGLNAFLNCNNLTIYCRSKEDSDFVSGWDNSWNPSNRPVKWSYNIGKEENIENKTVKKPALASFKNLNTALPKVIKKGITINSNKEYSLGAEILVEGSDILLLYVTIEFLDKNNKVLEGHENSVRVVNKGILQFGCTGRFECEPAKYNIKLKATTRLNYKTRINDAIQISDINIQQKIDYLGTKTYYIVYTMKNMMPKPAVCKGLITFYDADQNIVGGKILDGDNFNAFEEKHIEEQMFDCSEAAKKAVTCKYSLNTFNDLDLNLHTLEEMDPNYEKGIIKQNEDKKEEKTEDKKIEIVKDDCFEDIPPKVIKSGITYDDCSDHKEYTLGAEILIEGSDIYDLTITTQFLDDDNNVLEEETTSSSTVNRGILQFGTNGSIDCNPSNYRMIFKTKRRVKCETRVDEAIIISDLRIEKRTDEDFGDDYYIVYKMKNLLPDHRRCKGFVTFYDENQNIIGGQELEGSNLSAYEEQQLEEMIKVGYKQADRITSCKYSSDSFDYDKLQFYTLEEMNKLHNSFVSNVDITNLDAKKIEEKEKEYWENILPKVIKKGGSLTKDGDFSIGAEILVEGSDMAYLTVTTQFLDADDNVLEEWDFHINVVNKGILQFGDTIQIDCKPAKYNLVLKPRQRFNYTTKLREVFNVSDLKFQRRSDVFGDPAFFISCKVKNMLPKEAFCKGTVTFYDKNQNIIGGYHLLGLNLMPLEEKNLEEEILLSNDVTDKIASCKYSLDALNVFDLWLKTILEMKPVSKETNSQIEKTKSVEKKAKGNKKPVDKNDIKEPEIVEENEVVKVEPPIIGIDDTSSINDPKINFCGDSLAAVFSKRFADNDYHTEIVEDKSIFTSGNLGQLRLIGFLNLGDTVYVNLNDQIVKLQETHDEMIQAKYYDTEYGTFKAGVYKRKGIEFIILDDVLPKNDIIEIPDELDGLPVYYCRFSKNIYSDILELRWGRNLINTTNYTYAFPKTRKIVIPDKLNISIKTLLKNLLIYVEYSKYRDNIVINDSRLIYENNMILSSDKKKLYYCSSSNAIMKDYARQITIPEGIEIICENSLMKFRGKWLEINCPNTLKVIEDKAIFGNIHINNLPVDNLEVVSYPVLDYINKTIGPNVKDISNMAAEAICGKRMQFNSKYLAFENGFVMTPDKKELIAYCEKVFDKKIILPKSIQKVRDFVFDKRALPGVTIYYHPEQQDIADKLKKWDLKLKPAIEENPKKEGSKPEYEVIRNKCRITNIVKSDLVKVDTSIFGEGYKKKFLITKECAHIKELVIPEEIEEVMVDPELFTVESEIEIIHLPSKTKLGSVFNDLQNIKSLMLVIVNPPKKIRFTNHELPFAIGCVNQCPMYRFTLTEGGFYGDIENQITYVKNFDREALIIKEDAYYYRHAKTVCKLLKVKPIDKFDCPTEVDGLRVSSIEPYAFSKFIGDNYHIPEGIKYTDLFQYEVDYSLYR